MNKTRIYEDEKDVHVRRTMLYAKASLDMYLYTDSAFENKVTAEELRDMYMKGLVINYRDDRCNPVYLLNEYSGGAAVACFDRYFSDSTPTLQTFLSAECEVTAG